MAVSRTSLSTASAVAAGFRPRLRKVVDCDRIQNARTVGIDRLLRGLERLGGLGAFADADVLLTTRAQLVEHHEILAVGRAVAQAGEAEGHREDPAVAGQAWMA